MRINFNMNDDLIKRLDDYAKKHYMSRSCLMSQACDAFLTAQELKELLSNMREIMQKLADTQELDEKTLKELEDFSRLANMLSCNA